MKITFTVLTLLVSLLANATIRTVNNQSGSDADYISVNSALGASVDGDTIYIQPSPTSYGSFSLSKRLVIMGAGHNPLFSLYNSQIDVLTIASNSGSSIIKGVNITQITSASNALSNNVLFSGCNLLNLGGNPISLALGTYNNWVFEGNVIQSVNTYINISNLGSNAVFRNNYISSYDSGVVLAGVPNGTVFDHNIMTQTYSTSGASTGVVQGNNILLSNNIITTGTSNNYGAAYSCTNCTFNNNILWDFASSYSDVPGSNNLVNIDPQFSGWIWSSTYNYNMNFHVQTESMAINAASDGTDIGIYGGIFNFSPIGLDAGTPHIVDFSLESSTAPQGGTITIHLNANGSGQ